MNYAFNHINENAGNPAKQENGTSGKKPDIPQKRKVGHSSKQHKNGMPRGGFLTET